MVSDGRIAGTLTIGQAAVMSVGRLEAGQSVTHRPAVGERSHLYVASGTVRVNGETLHAGDAARATGIEAWEIRAETDAELVVWDLS